MSLSLGHKLIKIDEKDFDKDQNYWSHYDKYKCEICGMNSITWSRNDRVNSSTYYFIQNGEIGYQEYDYMTCQEFLLKMVLL
jgi:hypothetical protein